MSLRTIYNSTRLGIPEKELIQLLDKITQYIRYNEAYFKTNNIIANLVEDLTLDLEMLNPFRSKQYYVWLSKNSNGLTDHGLADKEEDEGVTPPQSPRSAPTRPKV